MNLKLIRKWSVVAALALASGGMWLPARAADSPKTQAGQQQPVQVAQAAAPGDASASAAAHPTEVASAIQLRTDAIHALQTGQFEQTHELIAKAVSISHDPITTEMSGWV